MDKGSKSYLYSIVLVAVLGGLLFGYDTAVISGVEKGLQAFFLGAADFQYTDFMHGFTSSSALIGCIIGALLSGMMVTIAVFTALFIYKSIFLRAIAIILPTIAKCKDTTFFAIRLLIFLRRRSRRTRTRLRSTFSQTILGVASEGGWRRGISLYGFLFVYLRVETETNDSYNHQRTRQL